MQFLALRKELENVRFESLREDGDDYFEAVVLKDELGKLTICLEKFLGSAFSPSKLPRQALKILKEFGGVRPGQRLYFKSENSDMMMVLFWPWSDGEHTTVKIIGQE